MKILVTIFLIIWTTEEISSVNPHKKNFLCGNGLYIRNDYICDGLNHCGDSSDEFNYCNMARCSAGSFACDCNRNRCLPSTARCNTSKECGDGSDEWNCGNDILMQDCTINRNKFFCQDGLKCIDFTYTCDGDCNCHDCSDENIDCTKHNENFCNTCSQPGLPTPNGPEWACNLGDDEQWTPLCPEIQHCGPHSKCDQKCIRFFSKERCICDENYQTSRNEITNERFCWSNVSHENVLLYTTASQLKAINLTNNITTVIQNGVNCLALAAAHNYVYCAIRQNNTASILKISQKEEEVHEIIKSDSRTIYSIEVDWITGNVYFTTNSSLSVCANDGKICTKLKSLSLGDSYHVSLAPRFGFLFWTISSRSEHEESQILRSAMDGSSERVLVGEDLRYPTSLVVDELIERVYWLESDVQFAIKSVQFNGKNKKEWISGLWLPWNIFDFSIFEKKTFFSTRSNMIYSAEKFINSSIHVVDRGAAVVKFVHVYNPLLQRTKIRNPCNESCTGLCLLHPLSPRGLNSTCLCDHVKSNISTLWCKNEKNPSKPDIYSDFFPTNIEFYVVLLISFLLGLIMYHFLCQCIFCRKSQKVIVAYPASAAPSSKRW